MNDRKGHGTSGVSHLADVAAGKDHYPVRRRGERRRLNPNQAGIAWLSEQAEPVTKTENEIPVINGDHAGLVFTRAKGWLAARKEGMYPGPMFKIVHDDVELELRNFWASPSRETACAGCDDWSRTASCDDHPEMPLDVWRTPSARGAFIRAQRSGFSLDLPDPRPTLSLSARRTSSFDLLDSLAERLRRIMTLENEADGTIVIDFTEEDPRA
ncbi:hypothetical protein HUN42_00065 [Streptomyces phage Dagobah]|nr:hypothetical protein HUN42_00065 [Streptomyces phage Dagobah]